MKKNNRSYWIRSFLAGAMLALPPVVGGRSAQGAQSLDGVSLTDVAPRILTPNGDMMNDVVYFKFDNTLSGLPIDTEVYDVNGAKISNLALNSNETALTWDGRNDSGQTVPSGIYIYSITIGSKRATGTVVVAR
jgi:gliding motility-associated-like protein